MLFYVFSVQFDRIGGAFKKMRNNIEIPRYLHRLYIQKDVANSFFQKTNNVNLGDQVKRADTYDRPQILCCVSEPELIYLCIYNLPQREKL